MGTTPIGHITILHGTATATADDGVRVLAVGEPVFEDDVIKTRVDSAVEILFADDTVLAQSENSEIILDEYAFNPASGDGNLAFQMVQGTFRSVTGAIVDHTPENFELSSPLGTIGIRGTVTAHTIPPEWSNAPEDHVVLVYDGKAVLVITTKSGEIRLIDTSGRKVEISDITTSDVLVMTVSEYLYYEQLAHESLSGQEPVWNSPEEVEDQVPGSDKPVGANPSYNPADYNQGDMDGDGDVDADDAAAAGEIIGTMESLVLEGNAGTETFTSGMLLLGGTQLSLHGSGSALYMLGGMMNPLNPFGIGDNTLLPTPQTIEETVASISNIELDISGGGSITLTLSATDIQNGFTVTPCSGTACTTNVMITNAMPPPAGTSVTANFSSFNSNQVVNFDASGVTDTNSGYFTVTAGAADDHIYGTNHNTEGDTIYGGDGDDWLKGYAGDDTIYGQGGEDTIYGYADSGSPGSQSDNDTLYGGDADDSIYGGEGNDTLYGEGEHDALYGGAGNDTLIGGVGHDFNSGGDGDDIIIFNGDADAESGEIINGGADTDTIRVDGNTDFSDVNPGSVTNTELLHITAGVTATFAETQTSIFTGLTNILGANNTLSTVESLIFNITQSGATLDLSAILPASKFTNWGSEDIVRINGNTGNETITGTDGNDVIYGGDGHDTIIAGSGDDKIYGEHGNDIIRFDNAGDFTAADTVNGGSTPANNPDEVHFTSDGTTTYTLANLTHIEKVVFGDAATTVVTVGNFPVLYEEFNKFDASGMTSAGSDLYLDLSAEQYSTEVKAGAQDNTIIGSSASDEFRFEDTTFDAAGDSVNGGAGTDVLVLDSAHQDNISAANLSSIERIDFRGSTNLHSWEVPGGIGNVSEVTWSSVTSTSGNSVDASGLTTNVNIVGNDAANTVTMGSGVDSIRGGASADEFIFNTNYTDDDTVDGQDGTADKMSFTSDGSTTYSLAHVSRIETITLGAAATTITLTGDLTGTSGTLVHLDGSGMGANVLTVDGSANTAGLKVTGGDGNDTVVFNNTTVNSRSAFIGGGGTEDTILIKGAVDFTGNAMSSTFNSGVEILQLDDSASVMFGTAGLATVAGFAVSGGSGSTTETLEFATNAGGHDFTGFNITPTSWGAEDAIKFTGTTSADTFTFGTNFWYGSGNEYHVDGGAGSDELQVTSDGSHTFTFAGVTGVEKISLGNANTTIVLAGSLDAGTTIDTTSMLATNSVLDFDGSNGSTGVTVNACKYVNHLVGGSGDDVFDFTAISQSELYASDTVNGGGGFDKLIFDVNGTIGNTLNTVRNVEYFEFHWEEYWSWNVDDAVANNDTTVTFDCEDLNQGYSVYINAQNETGADLVFIGRDFSGTTASSDTEDFFGGAGNDTFFGKGGNDEFTGNGGNDIFKYAALDEGGDTIHDFSHADDTFQFDSGVFDSGAASNFFAGNFNGQYFTNGDAGGTGTGFVYDLDSGELYYDPDTGSSGGDEVLIATLTGTPNDIDASDITVV